MFFFRADGDNKTGTGHIMRCLSLADALREKGAGCEFITAGPCMRPLIRERGYKCRVLDTPYDRIEEELPSFLPLLEEDRPVCVVLDSYFVTGDYMRAVKAKAPLVYIDDQNAFDYPADVVVNYNLYGKMVKYPLGKTYLLGPRYALLRDQFRGLAPHAARKQVEQILLSTGGTDQFHVALRCMEYLRENPPGAGVLYHFVLGAMNEDVERIKENAVGLPYIRLHQQVTDMCALMMSCDMAISAGGTTLFELCACGLPTVTYVLADNQIQNADSFAREKLMLNAGDIRGEHDFAKRLFTLLDMLAPDYGLRRRMSERMQERVDGFGAERLAARIMDWRK